VPVFHIMAAVSLVDKGARDSAAGEFFGVFDHSFEGMIVVRIARQRLGVQHKLAAWCAGVGGDD